MLSLFHVHCFGAGRFPRTLAAWPHALPPFLAGTVHLHVACSSSSLLLLYLSFPSPHPAIAQTASGFLVPALLVSGPVSASGHVAEFGLWSCDLIPREFTVLWAQVTPANSQLEK